MYCDDYLFKIKPFIHLNNVCYVSVGYSVGPLCLKLTHLFTLKNYNLPSSAAVRVMGCHINSAGSNPRLDKLGIKFSDSHSPLWRLGATYKKKFISTVSLSSAVSNLGVTVDNGLTMADHIASLCGRLFTFQLRQIRTIKQSITTDIHNQAFASSVA